MQMNVVTESGPPREIMHSSRSPLTAELKSSMSQTASVYEESFGVLLPICLLAVFLSCVVCVFHWQSTRERRLDMEDERKRKRNLSELDGGCVLRTFKSDNKNKVQAYPWKTSTKFYDLPDINNNDAFVIPSFPEINHGSSGCYGNSSLPNGVVGHSSRHHKKPIIKRPCIHEKSACTTGDLSGFSCSSEAEFNLSLPSLWSEDTWAEGCHVNESRGLENETGTDVIDEEQSYVIYPGEGKVTCVETIHGSLFEYWV